MKMAKASQADLDMAMELCNALDCLTDRWNPSMPHAIAADLDKDDEDDAESFDRHDGQQCKRALQYILQLADKASLNRVVWGAVVMLDPRNKLIDPDLDYIEHHPERLALENAAKTASTSQAA